MDLFDISEIQILSKFTYPFKYSNNSKNEKINKWVDREKHVEEFTFEGK